MIVALALLASPMIVPTLARFPRLHSSLEDVGDGPVKDPVLPPYVPLTKLLYAWAPMTLTSPLPKRVLRIGWDPAWTINTPDIIVRTVRL